MNEQQTTTTPPENLESPRLKAALYDAFIGWVALSKILVPVSLGVTLLKAAGGIEPLAWLLSPIMALVGLPGELGIVWAMALLVNMYAALAAFAALAAGGALELTVAQGTTLGALILFAHALPVEGAIARGAGLKLHESVTLRVAAALLYGALINLGYKAAGIFQSPAVIRVPAAEDVSGVLPWITGEIEKLLLLLGIIVLLNLLVWGLRRIGAVGKAERLLQPILGRLGIGPSAGFLVVVGLVLGISYGGALVFAEVKGGRVTPRDARRAMMLLCLIHSVFEDTLLMLLLGGEVFGLLILRALFSAAVMLILLKLSKEGGRRSAIPQANDAIVA